MIRKLINFTYYFPGSANFDDMGLLLLGILAPLIFPLLLVIGAVKVLLKL